MNASNTAVELRQVFTYPESAQRYLAQISVDQRTLIKRALLMYALSFEEWWQRKTVFLFRKDGEEDEIIPLFTDFDFLDEKWIEFVGARAQIEHSVTYYFNDTEAQNRCLTMVNKIGIKDMPKMFRQSILLYVLMYCRIKDGYRFVMQHDNGEVEVLDMQF